MAPTGVAGVRGGGGNFGLVFLCMGLQNSPEGRAVSFNACYSGPSREAERVFAKVRAAGGTPLRDTLRTIDYVALQRSGDVDDPRAVGSYTKSGFSAGLKPKFIDAILDGFGEPVLGERRTAHARVLHERHH